MTIRKAKYLIVFATSALLSLAFALENTDKVQEELPILEPTDLMSQETVRVIEMLETIHFNNHEVTREVFKELITEYMEDLDFNKIYFLEKHQREFQDKFAAKLSLQLRHKGDLAAAFSIYEEYRKIALDRLAWVKEQINQEWTFDNEETFVYDRSEEAWPATNEEAEVLWKKRIKYELLQELLNDKTIEEAKERITKRYDRIEKSIRETGSADVQELFLTSLTHMFDPHSTFFSSETLEDFNIHIKLSLVGIGALLTLEDDYTVIKELIPGGPAKRNKELQPEDRIVAVTQENGETVDIIGMDLRKVVEQIRGEKGTTVTLTVIPADAVDESERREIAIVRDVVKINSDRCTAEIFDVPTENGETVPIGVINIPTFYGSEDTSVTNDVEELVLKMKNEGVQAIVLDLRRNGGGLLPEAINMTGLFIRQGPVVQVKDQYENTRPQADRNPNLIYTGPLAVLTTRYSASASEIVAGALQNYGRALIIGNQSTHGKGTVQQVLPLEDYVLRKFTADSRAGAAKLTTRKFYLPNGFSTQVRGVESDIVLPSVEEIMAVGEAELDNALTWDYVKPAPYFTEMTMKESFTSNLIEKSKQRQLELEEFDFLRKRMDWYQKREDRKEISLHLEQRKTLMEKEEAFIDQMKDLQRGLAKGNFTSRKIKLDSVLDDEAEIAADEAEAAATKETVEVLEDEVKADDETSDHPEIAAADSDSEENSETEDKGDIEVTENETTKDEEKEEDEEPLPTFDIQLREALRIMSDAVHLSPNPEDWRQRALPVADSSKTRFEKLLN